MSISNRNGQKIIIISTVIMVIVFIIIYCLAQEKPAQKSEESDRKERWQDEVKLSINHLEDLVNDYMEIMQEEDNIIKLAKASANFQSALREFVGYTYGNEYMTTKEKREFSELISLIFSTEEMEVLEEQISNYSDAEKKEFLLDFFYFN